VRREEGNGVWGRGREKQEQEKEQEQEGNVS